MSRKGFDTTRGQDRWGRRFPYGGVLSPIFPDGSLYSLPIPGFDDEGELVTYGDLHHGNGADSISIGRVVEDLTSGLPQPWHADHHAFVSPNIRDPLLWEVDGQRGMFCHGTPSQLGHLRRQGVGVGDLFLFFGIFRRVEFHQGRWRFVPRAPRQHVLFGWLQVGLVHEDDLRPPDSWFVAGDRLDLEGGLDAPAFGIFPRFHQRLALTRPGGSVSKWRLPRWFYPEGGRTPLSYHPDRGRWGVTMRTPMYRVLVGGRSLCWIWGTTPRRDRGLPGWCMTLEEPPNGARCSTHSCDAGTSPRWPSQ